MKPLKIKKRKEEATMSNSDEGFESSSEKVGTFTVGIASLCLKWFFVKFEN